MTYIKLHNEPNEKKARNSRMQIRTMGPAIHRMITMITNDRMMASPMKLHIKKTVTLFIVTLRASFEHN